MRILSILAAVLLFWLGGCSTPSPGGGPGGPSVAAPKATLASEQRRLGDLFRGTPVTFDMQPDGSLRVAVPLSFSFDKGRFVVKPPLGKVLDLLARSQRLEPTRFNVAAPADPQSKGLMLATERATSARDYLVGRGVAATRFSVSALGSGDNVIIVIADTAAH